jgi:hypothetical protein
MCCLPAISPALPADLSGSTAGSIETASLLRPTSFSAASREWIRRCAPMESTILTSQCSRSFRWGGKIVQDLNSGLSFSICSTALSLRHLIRRAVPTATLTLGSSPAQLPEPIRGWSNLRPSSTFEPRPAAASKQKSSQGSSGRERTQALIPPIPIESLPANPAGSGQESENTNPP